MLLAVLLVLTSPLWVPLALVAAIFLLLVACVLIIIVSFGLVALLVLLIRAFYALHFWIVAVRRGVVSDAHEELKSISYYRLVRIYAKQIWKMLNQPRQLP